MTAPAKPSRQQTLASPRGAAIAGVIFSVLMITLGWDSAASPSQLI